VESEKGSRTFRKEPGSSGSLVEGVLSGCCQKDCTGLKGLTAKGIPDRLQAPALGYKKGQPLLTGLLKFLSVPNNLFFSNFLV
jgi:hypothetical protein